MTFLTQYGGAARYASRFLFQFFAVSGAGAMVVTCVAIALFLLTRAYLKTVSDIRIVVLQLLPSVLFLLLYNRYATYLTSVLGVLAALSGAILYAKMSTKKMWLRLIVFVILGGVVYYLAASAYLLYVVLGVLFELLNRRRILSACCLLGGAVVPYVLGYWVFQTSLADSYLCFLPVWHLLPINGEMILELPIRSNIMDGLYLFFPIVYLGDALWKRLTKKPAAEKTDAAPSHTSTQRVCRSTLKWVFDSPVFVIVVAVLMYFSFNNTKNTLLRLDYCARQKMWPRVLELADDLKPEHLSFEASCDIYRALYYTGRLPYEMFSYPPSLPAIQLRLVNKLQSEVIATGMQMKASDILLELGLVNAAEHLAGRSLQVAGTEPDILWRLAMVNIIKGKPEAARMYLNTLAKDVVHGEAAKEVLANLYADPSLSNSDEVRRTRALMLTDDYVQDLFWGQEMEHLLKKNPRNRMAFEYQMAYYLLTGQLENVVLNIKYLNDFGYPNIPRHYEEAILLYGMTTGKDVQTYVQRMDTTTILRFRRFFEYLQDKKVPVKGFEDTYFLYFFLYCNPDNETAK